MGHMDAFNIILCAYGYIINLYPIYDKLEPSQRNHQTLLLCCLVALIFSAGVYTAFAWLASSVFGLNSLK